MIPNFSAKASTVIALARMRESHGNAQSAFWEALTARDHPLENKLEEEVREFFEDINLRIARAIEEAVK